jgi:hypothetical protein
MKTAQEMMICQGTPGDKENLATKGLGILLENGPYGLMLYLETKSNGGIADHYKEQLIALCREELLASYMGGKVPSVADFQQITGWLKDLAQDLDRYLFMKRLWQQALTYARYHAKAREKIAEQDDGMEGLL